MDLIFTPAYAQSGAEAAGGGLFGVLIPLIGFFAIMYFLIIRPQQKRQKEHKAMIDAVRRGDEIITAGGFYAKVTRVRENDEELEAEIADGVRIRVVRSMIAAVTAKTDGPSPAGGEKPKPRAGSKPGKAAKDKSEKTDENRSDDT
jgi:preprotein translocase subunit YajC